MRNLLFQMRRVGKHLKSIIQKIMDRILKGTSVGVKSVGSVIGGLLFIIASVCLVTTMLLFVSAGLMTEGRLDFKSNNIVDEPVVVNVEPATVI